jgi:beta-phosphoglucomutase
VTQFPKNLRAVLFDADGVIIRSLETHLKAWSSIFAELGVVLDETEILLREGESAPSTFKSLAVRNGLQFTDIEVNEWVEKKRTLYRSMERVQVYPEIYQLLEQLRQAGKMVGLVTGSSIVNLQHVLTDSDLALFDVVFTAEDYERGKPDPEPYSKGVAALGIKPAEALVIENAPLGIRAATAAGIYCIALTTTLPENELQAADLILGSHIELSEFLKKRFGGIE